jgi:hypothetical protein
MGTPKREPLSSTFRSIQESGHVGSCEYDDFLIFPKYVVPQVVGFIKGESAIHIPNLCRPEKELYWPAFLVEAKK